MVSWWIFFLSVVIFPRLIPSEASLITLDLEPTTLLLSRDNHPSRRSRRLKSVLHEKGQIHSSFHSSLLIHPYNAGVYGALTEIDTEQLFSKELSENRNVSDTIGNFSISLIEEHNKMLSKFNSRRHLSRFESQYRQGNGFSFDENEFSDKSRSLYRNKSPSLHDDDFANYRRILRKTGRVPRIHYGDETESALEGGFPDDYQSAPLSQGLGTHYATVWVGTPTPQRKTLIVDTGSHHTAFPCKGCRDCGEEHHTDKNFDPESSKTFNPLPCDRCLWGAQCTPIRVETNSTIDVMGCVFSQSYTEGSSWQAYQVNDMVYFGGKDVLSAADPTDHRFSVEFMFGCQIVETGLFVTQLADGIMGLSQHDATLPRAMYSQGKLKHRVFGICFRREIVVSKKGVSAGVMTLGGINPKLHTSPMLYAHNLSKSGWYTVYVKNVFLRVGGGQSAQHNDLKQERVVPITGNMYALNSGKGVIIDSGTTDTYLHKSMADSFGEAWKAITGTPYTNNPMKLSREELLSLPTILIQIMADDLNRGHNMGSPDDVVGLVGSLDNSAPHDILLAVPSTHYMEYSPSKGVYTSRFYFTEGRGGVIGANSLQGHDVVFDWENGKIGIAESDCVVIDSLNDVGAQSDEAADCILRDPVILIPCMDTVDTSVCMAEGPENVLVGKQTWSTVIEFPGLVSGGLRCEEVFQSQFPDLPSDVECNEAGLCTLSQKCEILCSDFLSKASPPVTSVTNINSCNDETWGACLDSCFQSKMSTILMPDGSCHENTMQRLSRSCHVDFCGRSDPCLIPFVIHVILAFRGADFSKWNKAAEDCMTNAFTAAANIEETGTFAQYFDPGDVKVLMANPWYQETANKMGLKSAKSDSSLGIKVVLEVSLYNVNAAIPKQQEETLDLEDRLSRRLSECKSSDLYPLAMKAHDMHRKLSEDLFMEKLVASLKNDPTLSVPNGSLFKQTVSNQQFVKESVVFSSWTITTEPSGDALYDRKVDAYLDHRDNSIQFAASYVQKYPLLTLALLFVCVIFFLSPVDVEGKKDGDTKHSFFVTRPINKNLMRSSTSLRRRRENHSNLQNGYIGSNGNGNVADDESTSSKYSKLASIITN